MKKYDWKITGKKVFVSALAVLVAGGAVVYSNNPLWLAILPILVGIQNYFKHNGN